MRVLILLFCFIVIVPAQQDCHNDNSISVKLELYPSNRLTILQNATYQCTVDKCPCDACALYWTINGVTIYNTEKFTVNATSCCGEIPDGQLGKENITLIINGCEMSEHITVKCSLSNISKTSELYLQGKPGAVKNLSCQSFVTHINCSWSKPTIDVDGILVNYTLNITDDNGISNSTNTQYSNYSYNVSDLGGLGMYIISVAVVVGDGNYSLEGVSNFTNVSVTKDDSASENDSASETALGLSVTLILVLAVCLATKPYCLL